jgi:hypothetical protein
MAHFLHFSLCFYSLVVYIEDKFPQEAVFWEIPEACLTPLLVENTSLKSFIFYAQVLSRILCTPMSLDMSTQMFSLSRSFEPDVVTVSEWYVLVSRFGGFLSEWRQKSMALISFNAFPVLPCSQEKSIA